MWKFEVSPQTPSPVCVPVEPALFTFGETAYGNGDGDHCGSASLPAAASLVWMSVLKTTCVIFVLGIWGSDHFTTIIFKCYDDDDDDESQHLYHMICETHLKVLALQPYMHISLTMLT